MQDQNKGRIVAGDTPTQLPPPLKDPERLLRPARLFVILFLGISIVSGGSHAMQLLFLERLEANRFSSDAELQTAADANDTRQVVVSVIDIAIFTLTYILVGRWIYFSSKNVRAFGAVGLTIRPGWAVGWYFIPIANLWKPYQAMKELWQASSEPSDWARQRPPSLLPTWWSLWIAMNINAQVLGRLSANAVSIADFKTAAVVGITNAALKTALCVVFLKLIGQITRLQIETQEHKTTIAVFGSQP